MKKCTIGMFSKIITFLVFAVFFVPLTGICLYIAFFYPKTTHEERLIFLGGAVMFGGLVAFAIYRTFYLGLIWVEYDMEKVIFHYSRKEVYRFQWEEIPGNRVQAERAGGGYLFCIYHVMLWNRNGRPDIDDDDGNLFSDWKSSERSPVKVSLVLMVGIMVLALLIVIQG